MPDGGGAGARRVEVIGDATLYLGDCRDVLPGLGGFDAAVTDAPYEFSTSGGGAFRAARGNMEAISAQGLDAGFDHEVLNPGRFGAVVVFAHNDQWAALLPRLAARFGRYALCQWHKTNPIPFANRHYQADTETYVHAWNPGHHPVGALADKRRWIVTPNGQDRAIDHPTVKPMAVMRKIVGNVGGASVCDPFMGSGTTGVAALEAGRRFAGIERHEPYFDIACRRVEAAQRALEAAHGA